MTPWLQRLGDLARDGRWRRARSRQPQPAALPTSVEMARRMVADAELADFQRRRLAPDETWIDPEDIR